MSVKSDSRCLVLALALWLGAPGCSSLHPLYEGRAADSLAPGCESHAVRDRKRVTVTLVNGRSIRGRLVQVLCAPETTLVIETRRRSELEPFPAPAESVTVAFSQVRRIAAARLSPVAATMVVLLIGVTTYYVAAIITAFNEPWF